MEWTEVEYKKQESPFELLHRKSDVSDADEYFANVFSEIIIKDDLGISKG